MIDEKRHSELVLEPEPANYGTVPDAAVPANTSDDETPSVMTLLAIAPVRALCTSGFSLGFVGMALDVMFVLFLFTSLESGGLGFSVCLLVV